MFTNVKPIVAVMLTLAFALLIQPSAALADSNVAVVNLQKIMKESKAANAIRSQVQEKQKSFQAELDKKEKQLQKEDRRRCAWASKWPFWGPALTLPWAGRSPPGS